MNRNQPTTLTKQERNQLYYQQKQAELKQKRKERYQRQKLTQAEQIVQPSSPEKNEVETSPLTPEKIIRENERFITYAGRL